MKDYFSFFFILSHDLCGSNFKIFTKEKPMSQSLQVLEMGDQGLFERF